MASQMRTKIRFVFAALFFAVLSGCASIDLAPWLDAAPSPTIFLPITTPTFVSSAITVRAPATSTTAPILSTPTLTRGAIPTATRTPRTSPTPATSLNRTNRVFDVLVLVDALAPQTPREDVVRVFDLAAMHLADKTGEWLRLTDVVYGIARGSNIQVMVNGYLAAHPSNPPDGVLVFTNESQAHTYGGYSFAFKPSIAYQNEYKSPRSEVGADKIYVAVVEFDHIYARCGYNDAGNHVSSVSIDGECRNQPGTKCVQSGGSWVCATTLNDLYANHDYFVATAIIHEFLHPFGIDANEVFDHYGTPNCTKRTGMTAQQADDMFLFQSSAGLCPDVFARFRRSP